MRICLMIEGQEGVAWADWGALAQACERLGFDALFRSDHYLSVDEHAERGSLDAWGTVSALSAITDTLRFGTLVSPATFRHPSVLAKAVVTADHVSGGRVELGIGTGWLEGEPRAYGLPVPPPGGRLELGMGTGWLEDEPRAYGFPFPPLGERFDRLAEQVEIIRGSWGPGPFSFAGEHWTVTDLDAKPQPVQDPHPPLLLGGQAGPRAAALAARFA